MIKIKHNKAFTLIELMVVISIIAILASVGVSVYANAQKIARDGKRQGDIKEIQKALEQYYAVTRTYPGSNSAAGTLATVNSYFQNGIVPTDPTGPSYSYLTCSNNDKYVLCSTGMESCNSTKCNASSTLPANGCSGLTAGTAAFCVTSVSN